VPSPRGRPPLYCRPSHRVRAHEKRKALETRHPPERLFRLLKERLTALARWRVRRNQIPGMEEIRLYAGVGRTPAYQREVEKVLKILIQVAPELLQDLAEPWRAILSKIEATQVIDDQEISAVGDNYRKRRRL
jgi:hypothetical protein